MELMCTRKKLKKITIDDVMKIQNYVGIGIV